MHTGRVTSRHASPPPEGATASIRLALALSLGAAVSLGITRFAYGLLLPPMRADLGWTYALAGAMNTGNAAGYLLGALLTPLLLRRIAPGRLLVLGSLAASILMAASGLFTDSTAWLAQRFAAGIASAFVLIAGSLLAARMAATEPARGSLLIGVIAIAIAATWYRGLTWRLFGSGPKNSDQLSLDDARFLLGVSRFDDASRVRERHRTLIAQNHPDRGGSDERAAELNKARDLLLNDLDTKPR